MSVSDSTEVAAAHKKLSNFLLTEDLNGKKIFSANTEESVKPEKVTFKALVSLCPGPREAPCARKNSNAKR